jgi:hypothetical protein
MLQRLLKYNIVYHVDAMKIPSLLARDWAKNRKGLNCEDPTYIKMNVFDMKGCNEITLKLNGPLSILLPNPVTPEVLSRLVSDFHNNQLDLDTFCVADEAKIYICSQLKAWQEFTSIIPPFHLFWLIGGNKWINNLRQQKKQYIKRNIEIYDE